LPMQLLPKSETVTPGEADPALDHHSLVAVVERWRGRVTRQRSVLERSIEDLKSPKLAPVDPVPPSPVPPQSLDPNRFKLLKRPLDHQTLNAGIEPRR
jgi:hypothetical protein